MLKFPNFAQIILHNRTIRAAQKGKLYYITPEFTVLHWINVYGWRYVVRLLGNFNS